MENIRKELANCDEAKLPPILAFFNQTCAAINLKAESDPKFKALLQPA
jgi:hypothetical protein